MLSMDYCTFLSAHDAVTCVVNHLALCCCQVTTVVWFNILILGPKGQLVLMNMLDEAALSTDISEVSSCIDSSSLPPPYVRWCRVCLLMGWGKFWLACAFVALAVVVATIPLVLPLAVPVLVALEAVAVASCWAAVRNLQSCSAAPAAKARAWAD